ncbi:hypothetical protein JL475_29300 [Streptomyces sp. M2CJ-2]|uniref:hypothetical protein n=1 Tax=Streptomyces sp. M2CJ-2 TaxID=2803948 RepID=UPI0019290553|nr:hypothetical protein [Streptomyces sp. M2CJ-2]MBL3670007.1 hypothetical protein [Streptomyces sp. M2CJ-2]
MPDTRLTVTLSGEGVDDARVVVRALERAFGAPDGLPSDEKAAVHMATFTGEARADGPPMDPGRLSAPVAVTVQGAPGAVRRASDTLARAFTTRDAGAASGDQERQLLLEP